MGKSWDSTGIAFNTEMWAACLKILKPGGYLLAFSGTRTYHRMVCAIEDAGFEIRDMIEWMYGSGFPKSLNVGKAVDKLQGNDREDLGLHPSPQSVKPKLAMGDHWQENPKLIKGISQFEGYGTALKPAHEPCVLARKPLGESTVAKNVLEYGTGGLNIDGSRIGTDLMVGVSAKSSGHVMVTGLSADYKSEDHIGRWPSNLIHDGSEEVLDLFPDVRGSKPFKKKTGFNFDVDGYNRNQQYDSQVGLAEFGSASRFFYCAKASKAERNKGLDGFEAKAGGGMTGTTEQTLLTGSGNIRNNMMQNHHPTVKPLSLTKYLATLIKPPTPSRLLVPFSGSGSEMIGGLLAGFDHVTGVELTEEYIPIAQARCQWWMDNPNALDGKSVTPTIDDDQETLF